MSDQILHQLQERAAPLQGEDCTRAFALLTEEANRIKEAHAKLQERLESVNQELVKKAATINRLTGYIHYILKQISDAVVFIDLQGTVMIFNEAAQKLLKMKSEAILFKKFWEFFPDDFFGFSMREALGFGIAHRQLYRKEMEISTVFVYEGAKAHHGMILTLRDISEKERLQWIASRNDRMKELGEMASTVAHEIRNPLGGIRGYASLLYRDLEDQKHLQEMAGSIIEGTKSLEKVVSAILHYSKPVQIQAQTIELGAYLKQIGKFIKVDPAFPPNVKLLLHIPDAPLLVPVDAEALKRGILNLIFNAFQAMPLGGTLTLSLLKMDLCCQIAVTDTGMGMDEEQMKHLFSPFFTTKQKGHGLGLVETQKMIKAHLGTIEVRSQLGKGSSFTLTLPLKR